MIFVVRTTNSSVTDYYLDVIKDAFEKNGNPVLDRNVGQLKTLRKDDWVICARLVDAVKILLAHPRAKLVFWCQGIEPEESFLNHNSAIRKTILDLMEKIVIKRARFFFFVSDEMRRHLEQKHRHSFSKDSYYVMPCFNTGIQKEAFFESGKYQENKFTYVGSLSKWQKFEETMDLFGSIKKNLVPDAKLYVYTPNVEQAKEILANKGIDAQEVAFCSQTELDEKMKPIQYGFIIRDDIAVNRVATPTKISTYMGNGIIPIYSSCLGGVSEILEQTKFKVSDENQLLQLGSILPDEIFEEYSRVFETQYSREYHLSKLIGKAPFCETK